MFVPIHFKKMVIRDNEKNLLYHEKLHNKFHFP